MTYVPERGLFEMGTPDSARVVATLLAARSSSAGAGNRRALFATMDALLSGGPPEPGDPLVAPPSIAGGETVRLARMRLRNWKSFERADLELPAEEGRHVVVVGGENGFGKSSILEAFALGLFGRRALSDVGFLLNATAGRGAQRRGYRALLERNLHRSAVARSDGHCAVWLDFETADGPVSLERRWYFDETGSLIEEDEELVVRVGPDRQLLEVPTGVAAADWYQEEVERRVMPASLAPFFVFDGEQVERWADRRLTDQVRSALARMLGLEDLRGLVEDLRAYARDRERGAAGDGAADLAEAIASLERREGELADLVEASRRVDENLARLRAERDRALSRVASLGSGSHAELGPLLERRHVHEAEAQRLDRELSALIAESGPLLLAGGALIRRATDSIDAEMRGRADRLTPEAVEELWLRFVAAGEPLEPALASGLRERFARALLPADGGVDGGSHAHLDRSGYRAVLARLGSAAGEGRARLTQIFCARAAEAEALESMRVTIDEETGRSEERARCQSELADLTSLVEAGEGERGSLRQRLDVLERAIAPAREEAAARSARLRQAEPRLRGAAEARALAVTLERHMATMSESEHRAFGEAVTSSFRALAHKDQIARIEIASDAAVTLFDGAGRDITDYRLSAGESQLFAMSLIAAVGGIVGDRLPLIVDTPLGRLDTRHRESVVDMLMARRSQTVLLTQPEELTTRHMQRMAPVLAGTFRIVHAVDPASGVGVSSFAPDSEPAVGPVAPPPVSITA